MTLSEKRYDYILRSPSSGEEHGLLIDWTSQDSNPFQLLVKSETPPESFGAPENDELYTGRDLSDAWRIYFTNFAAGSGQLNRDTIGAVDAKYYRSKAIDISYPGELRLTHETDFISAEGNNILNSLCIEAEGFVVFGCAAGAPGRVGWLDENLTLNYVTGITETSDLTALASDGEYIYAAFSDEIEHGIWRGNCDANDWTKWSELSGIGALVYCGGYMYAVQGDTPGYLSAAGTFTALDVDAIHKPSLETFGFQSVGNWVYWGVTAGTRTRVYAIQHNLVEGDRFEHYVELPTGFVGTTMHGYLGNLYIAGYYTTDRGDVGQGAVYLATEQGIARLVNVGEDPNDKTSDELALEPDEWNNRVRVMYGYGAWLYIATDRALYRWDLDQGGLAHVVDIGDVYELHGLKGDPGASITWDPDFTVDDFTGFWDGSWGSGTLEKYEQRPGSIHHGLADTDLWLYSDTDDKAGDRCSHLWISSPGAFSAGTLRIHTTTLRQEALEFGIQIGTSQALFQVYARESDDKFQIRYRNNGADTGWSTSSWLEKRLADHTFHLAFDGSTANLWVDEVLVMSGLYGAEQATSAHRLFFGAGYSIEEPLVSYKQDWYTRFTGVWASLTEAASPSYIAGSALIPNMVILNGLPYVPCMPGPPSLDDDGFITQNVEEFVTTGWLETSWRSARMPTVEKHFTAIEVFYKQLTGSQSLRIDYEVDDGSTGSFTLPDPEDPLWDASGVSFTKRIDKHGRRIRLRFTLNDPGQRSSPRCYGACVRFNPAATKTYQLLTLFKDNLRDHDGVDYDYLDAYEFIMHSADTGEVLDLRARGIDVKAKITAVQFLKARASRQHSYEPQGTAIVQLQRVE